MKSSKGFLVIGLMMLVGAVVFLGYALCHPEASFSWPNEVTFAIYGVYLIAMVAMFLLFAIGTRKK